MPRGHFPGPSSPLHGGEPPVGLISMQVSDQQRARLKPKLGPALPPDETRVDADAQSAREKSFLNRLESWIPMAFYAMLAVTIVTEVWLHSGSPAPVKPAAVTARNAAPAKPAPLPAAPIAALVAPASPADAQELLSLVGRE